LLQHGVTYQATRRPAATAVVMQQERLTYGQLEASSNQVARMLRAMGCRKGDRVGLLIPKSPTAIVGILGILKADCIYVPLDPSGPAPRVAHMIAACEPHVLLAGGAAVPLLDTLMSDERFRASILIGSMDLDSMAGKHFKATFSPVDIAACSKLGLAYQNVDDDAAYILFTSGSTGTPKGVAISHANVTQFVEWAHRYFAMSPSDRTSGHSPLHFDLSVFDIFGTFAAGGQLHLVPPTLNLLPNKLADFMRTAELTQWFSVPSVLTYMAKFDVVSFHDFPALKRLLWCGEVLPTAVLIYWMKHLPHVRFTNLYGPTEATIASSYYTIPCCPEEERAPIPIGTACAGEELLVLDEWLRPVPAGEVANLYIRGVGLGLGYWRDPERTKAVFLPNPHSADPADRLYKTGDLAKIGDDGLVYFLGRADSQIKSRGYRIELGEIEAALNAMACVQECAVTAIPTDGFEGATICCAYVPVPDAGATPAIVRRDLSKVLPPYMLPSRWMVLERLPRNANGKIDRRPLLGQFQHTATQADSP
jgi:amino acid adenylation domain-containing protein